MELWLHVEMLEIMFAIDGLLFSETLLRRLFGIAKFCEDILIRSIWLILFGMVDSGVSFNPKWTFHLAWLLLC